MKINHNAFQRNSLFGYIHIYTYIHDIIRVVIWFSINTKQKISHFLKTNGNKILNYYIYNRRNPLSVFSKIKKIRMIMRRKAQKEKI